MSKQKIRLERFGLIKLIPGSWPPMYRLTEKAKKLDVNELSYRTTGVDIQEKIGAEDIFITIPIGDKSQAKLPKGFWEKINFKLKNNIQKHGHVQLGDYNVSIRETSKSVIIQLGPVDLRGFKDVIPLYNTLVIRLFQLLSHFNYWIDPTRAKSSDPEFTYSNAITQENADDIARPRVKEMLGFPREKILPGDQPEETWVTGDNTPHKGTIETNHRPLAAAWRSFPLTLENLRNMMGGMVYRDTQRFNMEVKITAAIEKIERVLSAFKGALFDVRGSAASPQGETSSTGLSGPPTGVILAKLEKLDPWERVKVRILANIRDFVVHDDQGNARKIDHLKAGSEIYLTRDQAIDMIKWGEAETIG